MLTSFAELLASRRDGAAVGAFTCYDLEAAGAVLRAAAGAGTGAILLIGGRSYTDPDGGLLLAALVAAARTSEARACVQLDHCADLAVIESALDAGAGAVMADGSELPYEENAAFVERAAELAQRHGAGVEAELGHLSGDEDVATAVAAGALTDPAEAADFVARTRRRLPGRLDRERPRHVSRCAAPRLGPARGDPVARLDAPLAPRRVGHPG